MRRPDWWPPSLWPDRANDPPQVGPGGGSSHRAGDPSGGTPVESFLGAFAVSSGAERAVLLRLDEADGSWIVETVVRGDGNVGEGAGRRTAAAGHPLTWCLREELLVQLRANELVPAYEGGGWALAGPVPGGSRVMAVAYGASPPVRAREALGAALTHLGRLEEASLLPGSEGDREPLPGSTGRR